MKLEGCVQSDVQNKSNYPRRHRCERLKTNEKAPALPPSERLKPFDGGRVFGFLPLNKRAMRKSVTSTNSFTAIVEQFSL